MDICGLDEAAARYPARSGRKGSAFGVSLLAHAVRQVWGMAELPTIEETEKGRPFFPAYPDRYFSISHSRTHVVCALASKPVGVDAESHRPISEDFRRRLMSSREFPAEQSLLSREYTTS